MTRKTLRCAVYTRKSTEEGLEQAFNSLDAQRQACAAYVMSQAGEGWQALPTLYDDGGFSGGSMDRPALERLLADIAARKVDVVVVYKVDRLTRSLADFAKIVEVLDQNGASFVSVTQAFNTTTSMGRLTLNVLLSFAQFEREVTGERIRDKIAMSKARGMWMGGMVPLGYDLESRHLVINQSEAALVRRIFQRYLELGSVHRVRDELEAEGIRSKSWTTRSGRLMGGAIFNRGGVCHILHNCLYVGQIGHQGQRHPGLHPPIIDPQEFEAVQAAMDANTVERRARLTQQRPVALLKGKIFDAEGEPMIASFSIGKVGRAYRYYISRPLQQGYQPTADGVIRRVNANLAEQFVIERLRALADGPHNTGEALLAALHRLELRREETLLVVEPKLLMPSSPRSHLGARLAGTGVASWNEDDNGLLHLTLPVRMVLRGGRVWIDGLAARPVRSGIDRGLVEALRSAHVELLRLKASPLSSPDAMSDAEAPATAHRRMVARLAFLAPDLQRKILEGTQPYGAVLRRLLRSDIPLAWEDQRDWFASLHQA
jgi:DNA invertase Pin-like site-specific DNA recombinase